MDDQLNHPNAGRESGERWPARVAFGAGSLALAGAMGTDFLSVAGRHLGHPLPGAIEVVQACIVVAVSSALIGATLAGAHAAVHVFTERMPETPRAMLARLANLLGALLFAALSVGGGWLLSDTWATDERSDLLGLPIAPLRIVWLGATAFVAVIFAIRIVWPQRTAKA